MARKKGDPMVGGESGAEGKVWGRGEHANMPKDVKFKDYPKASQFGPDVLDDTMGEIDDVNMRAGKTTRGNLSNQH